MPNPNNFDEASAATEDLFANEQLSLADVPPADDETPPANEGEPTGNPPVEEGATKMDINSAAQPETDENAATLEQATQTAEIAAQTAAEKDGQLQQAMQELETLRQQNQQLQGTIDEMSRQNTENIIEDALEDDLTPPTLDINGLAFADEAIVKAAQDEYAKKMADYVRGGIMKELEPYVKEAKEGKMRAARDKAFDGLSHSTLPQLEGIAEMRPQLDRIISANSALSSDNMDDEERYIMAYMIAKGVNAANAPKEEPTTDELMELYNNNPAFQELVEKQRLEQIKQSQQVPPFSASSGAVNAALDIKEKPQTLEEASERTRKMFGAM